MAAEPTYRSDTRPDFAPFEESCGTVTGFAYAGDLWTAARVGGAARAASPAPRRWTSSTTCWPSASSRR